MPEGTLLPPGVFVLFYGRTTGIVLDDVGDEVRLLDPAGNVADEVAFGELSPGASYSRDDDGVWHDDRAPSPGGPTLPSSPALLAGVRAPMFSLRRVAPGFLKLRGLENRYPF